MMASESDSNSNLSLRTLFAFALQDASKSFRTSALQDEAQDLVISALKNLGLVMRGVESAGMFSPNESLDDLPTSSIPYLALDYVAAEMTGRLRTASHEDRVRYVVDGQKHLHAFSQLVHQYGIISNNDQKTFSRKLNGVKNPGLKRDLKIQQFTIEKEVKNRLETLLYKTSPTFSMDNECDIIRSMLPSPNEAGEYPVEEDLRETYMLVIRLIWMRTQTQLKSLDNELELLRETPLSSPSPPPEPSEDTTWRLDPTNPMGGSNSLLDSKGRPLRPFTLLPRHASFDRASLKASVFRPDHRLPTMTIDEYLDKERQMGNIISGGGPQSLNAPTESELLTIDSEMEGTLQGEAKAEEKRQRDERWARYTDIHPKGEGNTMNQG